MYSLCCDDAIDWDWTDTEGVYEFSCLTCGQSVELSLEKEGDYWSDFYSGSSNEELEDLEYDRAERFPLCELCLYDRENGLWYSPCPH